MSSNTRPVDIRFLEQERKLMEAAVTGIHFEDDSTSEIVDVLRELHLLILSYRTEDRIAA